MKKLPTPNFKMDYVAIQGGEDLVTPYLSVKPGRAIFTQNYECDTLGRLRLVDGYEVFDGRTKPSEATYYLLNFDAGSSGIVVGNIVTGAGGASGEVIAIVFEGNWGFVPSEGYLVLYNVTGVYVNDEVLSVGGAPSALANGTQILRGASSDALDHTYLLLARSTARADIAAVPGSGAILGAWQYNGVKYAFRNNAGGTATDMYKSSTAGWVLCSLGERLGFSTGTAAFVEGETITQGGVTAAARRVVVKTGTWGAGTAAGYMVISGRAGGHFIAAGITGSVAGVANATGAETANAFSVPGGRFEFINHNFGGHASTARMYGVGGKNKGFEWDGTYFTPIETGMTTDTPMHLIAHKNHLFFMFSGGSIQHSGPGTPFVWSVVLGAGEIGIGDSGTGFISMPSVLAIFARNSTHLLYGTSSADWDLKTHSDEAGAIEWSIQKIGSGIYLDDRGLTSLAASDKYGDFKAATISAIVEPYIKTKLSSVQCSVRVKEKNQYRLIFNDYEALTLTLNGDKVVGFTRQYYTVQASCACSAENATGREEIFIGATNGFVYQMDSGNSFNGAAIEAGAKLHFNNLKTPTIEKRVRKIVFEIAAPLYTYIRAVCEFDYGDATNPGQEFNPESTGGFWGDAFWGDFVWGGKLSAPIELRVDGSGENFSPTLYHSGEFEMQESEESPRSGITDAGPHTIQGYVVHYDIRKVKR